MMQPISYYGENKEQILGRLLEKGFINFSEVMVLLDLKENSGNVPTPFFTTTTSTNIPTNGSYTVGTDPYPNDKA